MAAKPVDIAGLYYGNLHVIAPAGRRWSCLCSCGNTIEATRTALTRGKDSCGCVPRRHTRWGGRVYRSKYEVFTAMALDHLKIPYEYEPELFAVRVRGKDRRYLPDFHLIDDDSWLEVKGSKRGLAKFNYFAKNHRAQLVKKEQVERLCGVKLSSLYSRWRKHGPEDCQRSIAEQIGTQPRIALSAIGR